MSSVERSESDNKSVDPLTDPPEERAPVPCLDDISPDVYGPNTVVIIKGHACQFLYHEEHGPHVFFDTATRTTLALHTSEILALMESKEYFRPGGDTPSSDAPDKLDEVGRQYLRMACGSVNKAPRSAAAIRFMYVGHFVSKILSAQAEGNFFAKNEENAQIVVDEVDAAIEERNKELPKGEQIAPPARRRPRTVLSWLERETKRGLGPVGQVHLNALKHHDRKLPNEVFDTIGITIQEVLNVSGKIGPQKVFDLVCGKIRESNRRIEAVLNQETAPDDPIALSKIPLPGKSTVANEYYRYDPWLRLSKLKDKRAANLEYGAVGKLRPPKRVNDLWQIDHHKFDVHVLLGAIPWTENALPRVLSRGAVDRFWICAALDGASRYPVGFCISFEPGGLAPALTCIDHGVRIKTYVEHRWPHINGALLGYGRPVRVKYDNAKEFVGVQMGAALARAQIGFAHAKRRQPDSNPYIERDFGTWERDFVQWLKGATGSNPKEKAGRDPLKEARLPAEDFIELFHQYLIECYARRPQEELGGRSPEEVYMSAFQDDTCRPRPLTKSQLERIELITSLEFEATVTRDGIKWKDEYYQSPELQALRRPAGFNHRTITTVNARLPVRNIGVMFVAPPKDPLKADEIREIAVPCTNPHVHGLAVWQHEVVLEDLKARGRDPSNRADYQEGFLRLFRNALRKMGVKLPGEEAPKPYLTGGHAPRFAGVFQAGPSSHALEWTKNTIQRYDVFGEIAAVAAAQASSKTVDEEAVRKVEERISKWTSDPIHLEEDDDKNV